ncbi:amino acid adenylation domain-containing protein [Micromonospora sp. WMMC273]|uniref:amino acid adenylation domain-containing protein n=1 Tax=Micromonospora sp. WMMC273 TaxID=3015157 RepID=UPI0022B6C743|nr:amino acid adenylation domain-containing protein [Micromonospora sp. WMMC273]MCZ7474831.1 amino acid adenylation domain-containing protein [Micromonospora sp. WMMC273]
MTVRDDQRDQRVGPELPYPQVCLPDLVAAHARRRPGAPAVVQGDLTLSYSVLVGRAAALAASLRAHGIGADDLVGVCVDRRPDLVVALLGVQTAGAGYVPLDPALPAGRLRELAAEARLRVVVGTPAAEAFTGRTVLDVPTGTAPWQPTPATLGTTAYAMFTSGSTGQPKGAVIEHRALTEKITSIAEFSGFDTATRCLAFASIGFDASVADMLAPLAAGGTVVLAGDAERADPTRLYRICAEHAVDVVVLPPPILPLLDPDRLPGVRLVVTGGEATGPEQVGRWTAGGRRFISVYGPTEATVLVTWFEGSGDWTRPIPIGRPAANHRIHLVDDELREVGPGEIGEVLAGGPGLGRGYLFDAARTAERFLPDPFSGKPGERLYRTGDLARWLPDGSLEFLGRADRQVKIRGQRIELGEVEAVLRRHPDVDLASVQVRAGAGGQELVAYVATGLAPAELRDYCARLLPPAAVPARMLTMPALPITINGKIDTERLAALDLAGPAHVPSGEPPATDTERLVAQAWAALLDVPAVGRDDDFFHQGGHSITAMRLVADLRERLGRDLAIEDVLVGRTPRGIAARAVAAAGTGPADAAVRGRPPALSPAQQRLWFLDRYFPAAASAYNVAFAERITGPLDVAALATALTAVADRQQILRWRIPERDGVPYAVADPSTPVPLPVRDLAPGTDLAGHLAASAATPFALATDTLWRAELIRAGADEHVLAVYAHHAVFDGWSQSLFYADLAAAYRAALGDGPPLPPLPATYGDYVAWRADRARRRAAADLDWWLEHLTGAPVVLRLPGGRDRPAEQTYTSATVRTRLDRAATAALTDLAAGLGATPAAAVLAAFTLVLGRRTGLPDLVVGTPTVDRRAADFEPMVGFFIEIAPLRLRRTPGAGFAAHVRAAWEELLAALAHPEAPVERIVGGLGLGGLLDRSPLVQVLFNMYTFDEPRLDLAGLSAEPVPVPAPGSPFDLTLYGITRDGRLRVEIVFNPDVYGEALISDVLADVERLLRAGAADPERPVAELPAWTAVPAGTAGDVPRAARVTRAAGRAGVPAARPATATERRIASVWCDVLGVPEVAATDSFFDVGGGSLAVAVVQRQLNRLLGTNLRVVDLFHHPTVRALAAHLDSLGAPSSGEDAEDEAVARAARRGALRRQRVQRRPVVEEEPR